MSTESAQALIANFSEPITITRKAAGSYVNGIFVAGAVSSISATASVQPLNGREQVTLSELQRAKETLKMYTSTEVFVSNEAAGRSADLVSLRGRVYEVQRVEPWEYDFSFFKAILVRVEQ
jgi:hypothetical protein